MNGPERIPLAQLALMLLPLGLVGVLYIKLVGDAKLVAYATTRMVVQLILIGFVLAHIFAVSHWAVSLLVGAFMLAVAASIAVRPVGREHYLNLLIALACGTVPVLGLVLVGVLQTSPWYEPSFFIPLAGMVCANTMNALSLSADRFLSERRTVSLAQARKRAFETALLPNINSFFAVGLVSLPGMMTGQILAGADPIQAVKYQIVVMFMIAAATSLGCIIIVLLIYRRMFTARHQLDSAIIRRRRQA